EVRADLDVVVGLLLLLTERGRLVGRVLALREEILGDDGVGTPLGERLRHPDQRYVAGRGAAGDALSGAAQLDPESQIGWHGAGTGSGVHEMADQYFPVVGSHRDDRVDRGGVVFRAVTRRKAVLEPNGADRPALRESDRVVRRR